MLNLKEAEDKLKKKYEAGTTTNSSRDYSRKEKP